MVNNVKADRAAKKKATLTALSFRNENHYGKLSQTTNCNQDYHNYLNITLSIHCPHKVGRASYSTHKLRLEERPSNFCNFT